MTLFWGKVVKIYLTRPCQQNKETSCPSAVRWTKPVNVFVLLREAWVKALLVGASRLWHMWHRITHFSMSDDSSKLHQSSSLQNMNVSSKLLESCLPQIACLYHLHKGHGEFCMLCELSESCSIPRRKWFYLEVISAPEVSYVPPLITIRPVMSRDTLRNNLEEENKAWRLLEMSKDLKRSLSWK